MRLPKLHTEQDMLDAVSRRMGTYVVETYRNEQVKPKFGMFDSQMLRNFKFVEMLRQHIAEGKEFVIACSDETIATLMRDALKGRIPDDQMAKVVRVHTLCTPNSAYIFSLDYMNRIEHGLIGPGLCGEWYPASEAVQKDCSPGSHATRRDCLTCGNAPRHSGVPCPPSMANECQPSGQLWKYVHWTPANGKCQ